MVSLHKIAQTTKMAQARFIIAIRGLSPTMSSYLLARLKYKPLIHQEYQSDHFHGDEPPQTLSHFRALTLHTGLLNMISYYGIFSVTP